MFLIVGTFTGGFMGGAPSEGLYVFDHDPLTGKTRPVQTVPGLHSPSFVGRHPVLPVVYAVERQWSGEDNSEGAVTSFTFNESSGELKQIDRRRSGGAFTAHVRLSPDGRLLATANPLGPTIAVFPVDAAGLPGNPHTFRFEGEGARERQSGPWPHSCSFDPVGRRLYACDMGLDRIFIYDVSEDGATICAARRAFAQVSSGAGARHMAIRPDGCFSYVANELDGTISVFAPDNIRGTLAIVQTLSCQPPDFEAPCQPAEIVCTPDGLHLYVTVRGSETLGMYSIDADSGRLVLIGHTPCLGNTPRHISLSPDGAFAFVSNQLSSEIIVFLVSRSGELKPTGARIAVPSPTCVQIF